MSEGTVGAAERDALEVESMVPDEGKVSVLTRAELLKVIVLAWHYGQASLADMVASADGPTKKLAAGFACARLSLHADEHPEACARIAALATEGARSTGACSPIVTIVDGDGDGE